MNFGKSFGLAMSKHTKYKHPGGDSPVQYEANSPLMQEMKKPPLKFVKNQSYGLKAIKRNTQIRNQSR